MEDPDPKTLAAACRGDRRALAEIVALAQPDTWRFIAGLERDREMVEDLTQETLLRVVRGLTKFRAESRFRTWVFAIARNVVRDHQRRLRRRPRPVAVDERAELPGALDEHGIVEVWAAIDALPGRLREVFVLVEVMGLRYREVATLVGVREGTVKSRMFSARQALIDWMQSDTAVADE